MDELITKREVISILYKHRPEIVYGASNDRPDVMLHTEINKMVSEILALKSRNNERAVNKEGNQG